MKTGRSIVELAQELERQRDAKHDYVADTRQVALRVHPATSDKAMFNVAVGDEMAFQPTHLFHRQLGTKTGIPAKYYDRMMVEAPDLLVDNVNHWLTEDPERRMIRTLDGKARAFLSDRYRPLDHYDLAEAVLPKLAEAEAQIESCEVTESKLYIKAVCRQRVEEIGPPEGWEWGKAHHSIDVVSPGLTIANSEVGLGSLSIQPAVWTKQCSNLAVFRRDAMRKAHLGRRIEGEFSVEEFLSDRTRQLSDAALWSQVRDLVTAALDGSVFEKLVTDLRRARGHKIEGDVVKAVETVQANFRLSEAEGAGVLRHLIDGGDLTAYGLSNAVTRTSQDVDDYDRASELEQMGADIIELKPAEWREIAEAA